jgi:hypothetical protein
VIPLVSITSIKQGEAASIQLDSWVVRRLSVMEWTGLCKIIHIDKQVLLDENFHCWLGVLVRENPAQITIR